MSRVRRSISSHSDGPLAPVSCLIGYGVVHLIAAAAIALLQATRHRCCCRRVRPSLDQCLEKISKVSLFFFLAPAAPPAPVSVATPPVQVVLAQVLPVGRSVGRSVGTPLIAVDVDLWKCGSPTAAGPRSPAPPAPLTDATHEFTAAGKRNSLTRWSPPAE